MLCLCVRSRGEYFSLLSLSVSGPQSAQKPKVVSSFQLFVKIANSGQYIQLNYTYKKFSVDQQNWLFFVTRLCALYGFAHVYFPEFTYN